MRVNYILYFFRVKLFLANKINLMNLKAIMDHKDIIDKSYDYYKYK